MQTIVKKYWFLAFMLLLAFPGTVLACPDIDGLVDGNCDRFLVIVCFGDSITFGRGDSPVTLGYPGRIARVFPHAQVINLGKPGENTANGRSRAANNFPKYPNADYVIVLEGVNDYFMADRSAQRTRDNVLSMIRSGKNQGAITLLGNLTPVRRDYQKSWVSGVNREVNPYRQINFFALGEGIISGDLLHPNAGGYGEMANLVAQTLITIGAANRPADTDGDGIYDFAEPRFGGDPFVRDTDGDGISDGEEVFTYGSKPNNLNSDGDRFTDAQEVFQLGSNPGDARPGAPVMKTLEVIPR